MFPYSPVFGPGLIEGSMKNEITHQDLIYSPVFGPGLIEGMAAIARLNLHVPSIPRSSDRASLKAEFLDGLGGVVLLFPGLRTGPH